MGKKNNSIIISGILVAFLVGTIVSSPSASAANPVIALITEQVIPKLNQIITDITALTTGVSATTETQIDNIETETNKIQMVKNNQYIPFIETISGRICTLANTPTLGSITINSNADPGTPFVVTSIVMKPTGLANNDLNLEDLATSDELYLGMKVYWMASPQMRGDFYRSSHISSIKEVKGLEEEGVKEFLDNSFSLNIGFRSGTSGRPIWAEINNRTKIIGVGHYQLDQLGYAKLMDEYIEIIKDYEEGEI